MSKKSLNTGIAVTVTLIVVGIFFILGVPFSTQSLGGQADQGAAVAGAPEQLIMQDVVQGSGRAAQPGDRITVHYTGQLQDGTVFDTSVGKAPYSFTLGAGDVIPGWDQGLVGATPGTKRILLVPAQLAYGSMGYGPIPPNAMLLFEVDVVSVAPASAPAAQ